MNHRLTNYCPPSPPIPSLGALAFNLRFNVILFYPFASLCSTPFVGPDLHQVIFSSCLFCPRKVHTQRKNIKEHSVEEKCSIYFTAFLFPKGRHSREKNFLKNDSTRQKRKINQLCEPKACEWISFRHKKRKKSMKLDPAVQ